MHGLKKKWDLVTETCSLSSHCAISGSGTNSPYVIVKHKFLSCLWSSENVHLLHLYWTPNSLCTRCKWFFFVQRATYDWLTKISLVLEKNPDFWRCWFLITQSLLYSSWFMTYFCLKIGQNVTFVRYLNSCMLRSLWQMWGSWFILVGKKAENVQEDVRCFILLSRVVWGGKMSAISSGPGNNPHWRSISIFVFAWEDKNLPVVQ